MLLASSAAQSEAADRSVPLPEPANLACSGSVRGRDSLGGGPHRTGNAPIARPSRDLAAAPASRLTPCGGRRAWPSQGRRTRPRVRGRARQSGSRVGRGVRPTHGEGVCWLRLVAARMRELTCLGCRSHKAASPASSGGEFIQCPSRRQRLRLSRKLQASARIDTITTDAFSSDRRANRRPAWLKLRIVVCGSLCATGKFENPAPAQRELNRAPHRIE